MLAVLTNLINFALHEKHLLSGLSTATFKLVSYIIFTNLILPDYNNKYCYSCCGYMFHHVVFVTCLFCCTRQLQQVIATDGLMDLWSLPLQVPAHSFLCNIFILLHKSMLRYIKVNTTLYNTRPWWGNEFWCY